MLYENNGLPCAKPKVNFAKLEEEGFLKDKQEVFNKNSNLWPQENQQHLPTDTYAFEIPCSWCSREKVRSQHRESTISELEKTPSFEQRGTKLKNKYIEMTNEIITNWT